MRDEGGATVQRLDLDGRLGQMTSTPLLQNATLAVLDHDGKRVAYTLPAAEADFFNDLLFVAGFDGTDAVQAGDFWFEGTVVWSPAGQQLAYIALDEEAYSALYVVRPDGHQPHKLLRLDIGAESGEIVATFPAWPGDPTHPPEGRPQHVSNRSLGAG
ncbi:MAG: hypothetical protein R3300_00820 [Candidatus Promineifilaceae bacterium]|nr:hypothetical protein [Candidatus Promineifilaceae bacterium]